MKRHLQTINVNASIFAKFVYTPYFKEDKECAEYDTTYKVGDVVVINERDEDEKQNIQRVGVVLGCIDEVREDLRTDMSGMVCYCDLERYEPAKHLHIPLHKDLKEELKRVGVLI